MKRDGAGALPEIRHDWTLEQIRELAEMGLLDLVFRAAQVRGKFRFAS